MTEEVGAALDPESEAEAHELDPLAFLAFLEERSAPMEALEMQWLRRFALDPQAAIWMPACRVLGAVAHRDGEAYLTVQELLHCPLPELRLRGVVALGPLAAERSDEVTGFVEECLGTASDQADAVLLEAVLALLPRLPDPMGRSMLVHSLFDARVPVRAAATASLAGWDDWPPETLARLAEDPSSLVRAALVKALSGQPESDETRQAWELLGHSPEPYFRAFLAEELRGLDRTDVGRLLADLAEDASALVRDAATGASPAAARTPEQPPAGLDGVRAVERDLDANPQAALEILRPVLEGPEACEILDQLSYLCRDLLTARLCRALQRLLEPSTGRPAERLSSVLDVLANCSGENVATAFKRFAAECARALPVRSTEEVLMWATFVQRDVGFAGMETAERGLVWLVELATQLGAHELSAAAVVLDEAAAGIDDAFPLPERTVLRMVARAWAEMLDAEIDHAFASVNE